MAMALEPHIYLQGAEHLAMVIEVGDSTSVHSVGVYLI